MIAASPAAAPHESVRAALARYLAENGFDAADYARDTFTVRLGPLPLTLRNTRARRQAIPLHDLHHVATGYGTDFVGEGEIGIWELRAGCTSFITWFLNGSAALIGLLLAPRRTLRALRRARGARTLYRLGARPDEVLDQTVGELRARLGLPPQGLRDAPALLHAHAPGLRESKADRLRA